MYEQYIKYSQLVNRKKLDLIYTNQELVFEHYFEQPIRGKKYCSFFRNDTKPGCRFTYYKGKLWFVDNAPLAGHRLYSDCIQAVCQLYKLSEAEAVNMIIEDLDLIDDNEQEQCQLSNRIITEHKHKPIIKFKPIKQKDDSYFLNQLDIDDKLLWKFNCFLVGDYWANTKSDSIIKKNVIGNPTKEDVYAFYSKTLDNANLYFPTRDDNKFYKALPSTYFYGQEAVDLDHTKPLIIQKSGKDALVIKKVYPNVIAVQTELRIVDNPILKMFPQILIWYDNDYIGYSKSEEYKTYLLGKGLLNVDVHHHPDFMSKDPADMYLKNKDVFTQYFNYEVRRQFNIKS